MAGSTLGPRQGIRLSENRFRPETEQVLFTCYAPAGIPADKVWDHLHNLEAKVKLISPEAKVEHIEVTV